MKVLLANWWLPLCKQEDMWDTLINAQLKEPADNTRWTDAVRLAEQENMEAHHKDLQKDIDVTKKMQKIIDKEMELALAEGQTIIRGRKRRPLSITKPP